MLSNFNTQTLVVSSSCIYNKEEINITEFFFYNVCALMDMSAASEVAQYITNECTIEEQKFAMQVLNEITAWDTKCVSQHNASELVRLCGNAFFNAGVQVW